MGNSRERKTAIVRRGEHGPHICSCFCTSCFQIVEGYLERISPATCARLRREERVSVPAPWPQRPVLALVGSRSSVAREQARLLGAEPGVESLLLDPEMLLGGEGWSRTAAAFIEVALTDRDRIRAALLDVIDSTRAEEGCEEYRCYEDTQQPGCYVFIERWRDKAALDLHLATPHMAAWMKVAGAEAEIRARLPL